MMRFCAGEPGSCVAAEKGKPGDAFGSGYQRPRARDFLDRRAMAWLGRVDSIIWAVVGSRITAPLGSHIFDSQLGNKAASGRCSPV